MIKLLKKLMCLLLLLIMIIPIISINVEASSDEYSYNYGTYEFVYRESDIISYCNKEYTYLTNVTSNLNSGVFIDSDKNLVTDKEVLEKLVYTYNAKFALRNCLDLYLICNLLVEIEKAPEIVEALGDDLIKSTISSAIATNIIAILKTCFLDASSVSDYAEFASSAGLEVVFYFAYLYNLLDMIDLCTFNATTLNNYIEKSLPHASQRGFTYEEAVQYELYVRQCVGVMSATVHYLEELAKGSSYNKESNGLGDILDVLQQVALEISDSAFQESFTSIFGCELAIELLEDCSTGKEAFDVVYNALAVSNTIKYYQENYNMFSEDYYLKVDKIMESNSKLEPDSAPENDPQIDEMNAFNLKINEFKKKYADGSIYKDNPKLTGGYECFGFANELALRIFGSYPTSSMSAKTVNKGWSVIYGGDAVDNLCVGDIVRYKYHSIFITGIDGDTIYYCQANVPSGTNKVTYENSISRSALKSEVSKKLTSPNTNKTGWVAHYKASKLGQSTSKNYIATDFSPTIKDGIYTLKIAHSSGKMLNVYDGSNSCVDGTKLTTWSKDGTADQKFYFKHEVDGKYRIYAICSGVNETVYNKAVDVNIGTNEILELGDYFDVWSKAEKWNYCQQFYIVPVGNGKYVIELSSKPNAVLSAKNSTEAAKDGGSIILGNYESSATQQWYFYDESGTSQVDPSIDATTSNIKYYTGTYKVNADIGLNIRSSAGSSYKKLGALINNTSITVVQVDKNWGKIIHDGITGWVCLDYTKYISPLVTSISINTLPNKMSYYIGEELNTDGLKLNVTYSDDTSNTISEGFTCTPLTLESIGKQTIYVKYNGIQTSFEIDVVNKTYTVNYNIEGSTNVPSSQIKEHDVPLILSTVVPSKEGYSFLGWSTSSTSTTPNYQPGDTYNDNADVTLYAVWEEATSPHIHDFTNQNLSDKFKASSATCQEKATYYYSCNCGDHSDDIFEYGNLAEHKFTNYISNNDATYTEDGTKTAKCEICGIEDTILDIGSALGMAQKFRDAVKKLNDNTSAEVTYAELCIVLEIYASLSGEEKEVVVSEFEIVKQTIKAYNTKVQIANNDLADATKISFAPLAVTSFTFLSVLWFILKKKFII